MFGPDIAEKKMVRPLDMKTQWLRVFGLLPAFYIGTSFLNFAVGATFGLLMALYPNLWGTLASIHAELNPYGWLTILIYGMTYAVLKWFANIESPWPKLAWFQLIIAEAAVIMVTIGQSSSYFTILRLGFVLQALAPILFLINILASVAAKRKAGNRRVLTPIEELKSINELSHSGLRLTDPIRRMYAALGNTTIRFETDSIAQRGTDMALMIFIISTSWVALASIFAQGQSSFEFPPGATVLTYYGWIAGTVLSVSLHLYQRYAVSTSLTKRSVQIGQGLWVSGLLVSVIGLVLSPSIVSIGSRLLGLGFLWFGVIYCIPLRKVFPGYRHPVHLAWKLSTLSLLALGAGLLIGMPLIDLPMFHVMFLGWMTTLVYGVGYTFFPLLLRRNPRYQALSFIQVWLSLVGVILMVSGFYCMEKGFLQNASEMMLAIGGVSVVTSVLYFLLQWPFGHKTGDL